VIEVSSFYWTQSIYTYICVWRWVAFQSLKATTMNNSIFLDITIYSPVKVNESFLGTCVFHIQSRRVRQIGLFFDTENRGGIFFWNFCWLSPDNRRDRTLSIIFFHYVSLIFVIGIDQLTFCILWRENQKKLFVGRLRHSTLEVTSFNKNPLVTNQGTVFSVLSVPSFMRLEDGNVRRSSAIA
jgi:hypothetical protein